MAFGRIGEMKKSFTQEQIVATLRSVEGGTSVADACRKLGITDVFRVNGPAGLAALGVGTTRIPKVRKIVGPGSPAVTIAQVELQRHCVATMMLLGAGALVALHGDLVPDARLILDARRHAHDLLIEAACLKGGDRLLV